MDERMERWMGGWMYGYIDLDGGIGKMILEDECMAN